MTDETLLELVQSVGGLGDENQAVFTNDQLRLLIAMVRNAEREECARIVENYCGAWDDDGFALAATIRARGQA